MPGVCGRVGHEFVGLDRLQCSPQRPQPARPRRAAPAKHCSTDVIHAAGAAGGSSCGCSIRGVPHLPHREPAPQSCTDRTWHRQCVCQFRSKQLIGTVASMQQDQPD